MFKDLATLVVDQGTVLDRIDYNMEQVVEKTKAGIKQLEKAEKYQKKSTRALKCIMCLMLTVVVLVIIVIMKHK